LSKKSREKLLFETAKVLEQVLQALTPGSALLTKKAANPDAAINPVKERTPFER